MEELGDRSSFDRMGTLGVEEEFFVVDDEGMPVSGTDELVYGDDEPPAPLSGKLDHELFKFTIETQTPLIEDVADAANRLVDVRDALVEHAGNHGYRIAGAGLHPEARWRELDHAEKPRYRSQLDRIQYPQHRNTTAGLHVHVGVDDADKAVWIANELRWELPPLLALSANSPFWNGFDTGLASARAKIFENLPNTGMPGRFADYEAFAQFERRMVERGSIDDRGELWFDVRPHTGHGTVEIRTPDGQADPAFVQAFVEGVHALVIDLAERYEDGEREPFGPGLRRELLDENKWRATRHGHEASFVDRDGESTIGLADAVERTCDRIGDDALATLLDRESGSRRQRRIFEERGSEALRESLVL
ncbi:MAG: glutamate--cysteine ligase [Halolamina sp.]